MKLAEIISKSKYLAVRIILMWKSMEKRRERNPLHYYFIMWRGKSRFVEE
jgi:hypothetical protein